MKTKNGTYCDGLNFAVNFWWKHQSMNWPFQTYVQFIAFSNITIYVSILKRLYHFILSLKIVLYNSKICIYMKNENKFLLAHRLFYNYFQSWVKIPMRWMRFALEWDPPSHLLTFIFNIFCRSSAVKEDMCKRLL